MNIKEMNRAHNQKESSKELMIYIHIPFCERKCEYCDFLSAPGKRQEKEAYVNKLIEEIKSHKKLYDINLYNQYNITSIFIGGGTPSSLELNQINRIMETLKETFPSFVGKDDVEITIEVNPGTASKEKLLEYKNSGINRISFGLQSTDNKELKQLGRIHNYEIFLKNYELAREVGFSNINIDLISALPGQQLDSWSQTLERVIALQPEHISAYSLIIEEGTPFYDLYGENYNNEETDRLMYSKTKEMLSLHGYNRYEISNYAKSGYESSHNIGYWTRKDYLGLGLGSSSYLHGVRMKNETNLAKYLNTTDFTNLVIEKEVLSQKEEMEEFMFLGLRLIQGVSRSTFLNEFGKPLEDVYEKEIKLSVEEGLLAIEDDSIYLTEKGLDLSNIVMARFLQD